MILAHAAPRSLDEIGSALHHLRAAGARSLARRAVRELMEFADTWEPERVSVVLPVCGEVDTARLRACIASARAQRGVEVEVVLAEQTFDALRYEALAGEAGAVHVGEVLAPRRNGRHAGLGRARNVGIAASTGRYVYLSDADIIFPNPRYLAQLRALLEQHPDAVAMRPRMQHLAQAGQREACASFVAASVWPPPGVEACGAWAYYHAASGPAPRYHEVRHRGREYVIEAGALRDFIADGELAEGWEPRYWTACRHDGALMARRVQLDMVAGYAECFMGWGVEDADLLWKMSESFHLLSVEHLPGLGVVHLDHERGYYDKLLCERNRLLHQRRRERGVLSAILGDVLENASPYGRALRARVRIGDAAATTRAAAAAANA